MTFLSSVTATLTLCISMMPSFASCNATDRDEIYTLLERVELSACRFIRNGSGYSAKEAAQHLRTKWRAGNKLSGEMSAEQFISQIATTSSMSGQPYMIDCGAGSLLLSSWLAEKLREIRAPL
jgi:hypothetical protein